MDSLSYWLEYDEEIYEDYGVSGLIGAAKRMYDTQTGVQEYLAALQAAGKDDRKKHATAIFETLYLIAERNDKETLATIIELCPWLIKFTISSERRSPLDVAVVNGAWDVLDTFIAVHMYDVYEAMYVAIEAEKENAVLHLLKYEMEAERFLEEAIVSTPEIRNAIFKQLQNRGQKIFCGNAVKLAITNDLDECFIRELVGICSEEVFCYCFEDGRCLLDYAKTEEVKRILLSKGAICGNRVVQQLLNINGGVHHLVYSFDRQDSLFKLLLTSGSIDQCLYDMCHRNGVYEVADDLLYSILKHGGFVLFETLLLMISKYDLISGELYSAPFNFRVKWTHQDWVAYDRIARTLIDRGVPITCNPIAEICDKGHRYISTLKDETKIIIFKLMQLFHENGVDINQQQQSVYAYNPLARALFSGNEIAIVFLLKNGVKVVSQKEMPLAFLACRAGYTIPPTIMRTLKEAGFNINEKNKNGNTVLHSICNSQTSCIDKLNLALSYGANASIPNDNGKLPIHIAREWGHIDMIRRLEANGV